MGNLSHICSLSKLLKDALLSWQTMSATLAWPSWTTYRAVQGKQPDYESTQGKVWSFVLPQPHQLLTEQHELALERNP